MRLLFLTPLFPYPPNSGGLIKTWTLLEFLRERCQTEVLCFHREELSADQRGYASRFEGEDALESLPLKRGRGVASLLRSYVCGLPLSVYRNRSREMIQAISRKLESGQYDVLFFDHWLMAQYLPPGFHGLSLLHMHNAESLVWERQAALEQNPALRPILRMEAKRVRNYERANLPRFDRVLAVSEEDREVLIRLGAAEDRVAVLPNVPDPALLELPPLQFSSPPDVLYFGTLSWEPNAQGLQWFLKAVLPGLKRELPGIRLIVAGGDPPRRLRDAVRREDMVELMAAGDSVDGVYRRARAFVEPVQGGGGTKLKVLSALARGLPVVTTSAGAAGIDAVDGEHLLIRDTPEGIVSALKSLLTDESLWRRLSENGRRLIAAKYRPQVAYQPLSELLAAVS